MPKAFSPPDIVSPIDADGQYRQSWSLHSGYLNREHAGIWEATKHLPGWQDSADSEKLYEMAYYCGGSILEIGTYGGRSAVVQLQGALCGMRRHGGKPPQFYGLDTDRLALPRTFATLQAANLQDYCLLYFGELASFHRDIPITPTMVFVDGDHSYPGVWADLNLLSQFLVPGTPVFCHDYRQLADVRRAVDKWVYSGHYTLMGCFGCGVLLRANQSCSGSPRCLSSDTFKQVRRNLHAQFFSSGVEADQTPTQPLPSLTEVARSELAPDNSYLVLAGQPGWPFTASPDPTNLPTTLPGGKPWPKISIVTPSYNYGRYLESTILSVLNQNYPNFEHIIIDGGSTDETLTVLERYRDRVAYIASEKDSGQSNAINKGFARATGDILTWLNSDDMLAPGALAAVAMGFYTSGADMVAGICQLQRDGLLQQNHLTSCPNGLLPLHELLSLDRCWNAGRFFFQPEVMFTREIWQRAGARVREDVHYSMDYELWLRFAKAKAQIHVIGRPVAIYRMHDKQKTAIPAVFQKELVEVRDAFVREMGPASVPYKDAPCPNSKLRILFLNDLGPQYGAGIAHNRLAKALALGQHHVAGLALTNGNGLIPQEKSVVAAVARRKPDLLIVGNIHAAIAKPNLLAQLSRRWPTLVVLHDFWALTGRCAYPGACTNYIHGCDRSCPTATEYPALPVQEIRKQWKAKQTLLASQEGPKLLAYSTYASQTALRLFDRGGRASGPLTVQAITIGLPLATYRCLDRAACRARLNLPQDRFIIFVAAVDPTEQRKGVEYLYGALDKLNLPDVLIIVAGMTSPKNLPSSLASRALGYLSEPEMVAAYGAADLFVGPSLDETLGQVFLEAAACGTPSIGFPVAGVQEAIKDGVTGRLAKKIGCEELAAAIHELYRDQALRANLRRWARLYAENEWSEATSCHKWYCALEQTGLGEAAGLSPKIALGTQPQPVVWDYISGSVLSALISPRRVAQSLCVAKSIVKFVIEWQYCLRRAYRGISLIRRYGITSFVKGLIAFGK